MPAGWPDVLAVLSPLSEAVKIIGGFASLYAIVKLRQIERRYLFKATLPGLIGNIAESLSGLNRIMLDQSNDNTAQLHRLLNRLIVDVKNVKRKARGDSVAAADQLLDAIRATGLVRKFWMRELPITLERALLLDIYGKGAGLLHSLGNDVNDLGWSGK